MATGKEKLVRYLRQPSTQQGLNLLASLVALKLGVPAETVLTLGAMVVGAILIIQDDDKK